ncbi:CD225/dispanin family protein [Pseudoxanthomonas indica]|uniref:Interferon-induced transmembrane protein n=1 Tax=Pseudoxanthomonas indica TaxID=428993 RepID=A0A1T5LBU5_9GAMM|nr:CD225/dispanin family protein [Pseudoxanthomonas indica]GGD33249.1 membrane protein [Pseudoxanthomonas indica]SKC73440.1 Interferon-induced transmembrane protein [Pseudoxanthomonas indica]
MSAVPPLPNETPVQIPNYLAWSIISTVLAVCLCCPLGFLGIVAIVYSSQVNTKLAQGDVAGARRASDAAKTWCWVATALAIIGLLINIFMVATGGVQEYMEFVERMQQVQ